MCERGCRHNLLDSLFLSLAITQNKQKKRNSFELLFWYPEPGSKCEALARTLLSADLWSSNKYYLVRATAS